MSESRFVNQARVFGLLIFVAIAVPTVLMTVALAAGTVGVAPRRGLVAMAILVLGFVAWGAARALRSALEAAAGDLARTHVDAWVAAYVGAAVLVVGAFAVPIVMLLVMVNSDRSLADSGTWFFVIWIAAHVIVGGAAHGIARLAFGSVRNSSHASSPPHPAPMRS